MYTPVETYRGFVYPWVIDHVGHMNVQSYTARFDEASWHFAGILGMSPLSMKAVNRSFVAVEQRIEYKREVVCGSLLHVSTELLAIGRSSMRIIHRMFDSDTNTEVASSEMTAVHFDLVQRISVPLPEHVAARAYELLAVSYPSPNALALGLEPAPVGR